MKSYCTQNNGDCMTCSLTNYGRDCRNVLLGERFGTAQEHALWMQAADSDDVMRKQRGQGYRDGLKWVPIS
jgi:hypothetical protein